jgi:HK97 gp10 family phage protein
MASTGVYGYRVTGGGAVQIEGLRETLRDLRDLGKDAKEDMKETHRRAGEIVAAAAKPLAPVRTGALSKTIVSSPTQYQGRVRIGRGASVPYAGPIHFGWPARGIRPQPFIYDALDGRREQVLQTYESRIGDLIARHNLAPGQRSTTNR